MRKKKKERLWHAGALTLCWSVHAVPPRRCGISATGRGVCVLFVQFMFLLMFGNGKIFLSHGKADEMQDFPLEELIPREPESCSCLAGGRALVAPELEAGQTGFENAPAHPAFPQPPQRQVQAEARVFLLLHVTHHWPSREWLVL